MTVVGTLEAGPVASTSMGRSTSGVNPHHTRGTEGAEDDAAASVVVVVVVVVVAGAEASGCAGTATGTGAGASATGAGADS